MRTFSDPKNRSITRVIGRIATAAIVGATTAIVLPTAAFAAETAENAEHIESIGGAFTLAGLDLSMWLAPLPLLALVIGGWFTIAPRERLNRRA